MPDFKLITLFENDGRTGCGVVPAAGCVVSPMAPVLPWCRALCSVRSEVRPWMWGLRTGLFWAMCGCLVLFALGCASSGPLAGLMTRGIVPVERTVHAVMGQMLVVPVRFGSDTSPIKPISGLLDDGRSVEAEVFWISASSSPMRISRWLADPGVWVATPAASGRRPSADGFWAIAVNMPIDAVGQGVWIDGARWGINWLDHAGLNPPIASPIDEQTMASDRFQLLAEPEERSPMLRFRSRLIAGQLGAIDVPGRVPALLVGEVFDDPIIEAYAMQQQARWAAGINALGARDELLAARLRSALCQTVNLDGMRAPAWPTDQAELGELLADLNDPRLSDERRARFVAQWLDEQPAVVAWVADDAGLSDAVSGQSVATVAAANIGDVAQLVSLKLTGGEVSLRRVEPGEQVLSHLTCPIESEGPVLAEVQVQGNRWASPIRAEPILVRPPGASMSPMYVDRTLEHWRSSGDGVARAPQDPGGAAALLMRASYADPSDDSNADTWAVYVECITGDGPMEGSVRIWIGPTDAPLAALTVFADGRVEEERVRRTGATSVEARVSVARRDDRWSCLIPLPQGCIDRTGVVRIGIEHVGSDGIRSAWPRPMFPWQDEPARAAFDTTAWGSLSIFGGRE